ncbi:ankyrin repeat-containing domain protein [Baffinella frigidus]|nr:ankyrin repeat-containing domain protein [Cryptophyta sp. CCMP2293]
MSGGSALLEALSKAVAGVDDADAWFFPLSQGEGGRVDELISDGEDANFRESGSGLTPLHYACRAKLPLAVISLLEAGANALAESAGRSMPPFAETFGGMPLDESDDPEVLHALLTGLINRLERGSSDRREDDLVAAMHTAAALGDVERAKSLLVPAGDGADKDKAAVAKLSASVDGRDPLGRTPLHWACYRSQASTADFLLSRGADPEARASPRVDRLWVAGLWDTRARSMAEGGLGAVVLLEGAEEELGPTALDVVQRQHAARVIAKSVVDMAFGMRVENDYVSSACSALAMEARYSKEAERLRDLGLLPEEDGADDGAVAPPGAPDAEGAEVAGAQAEKPAEEPAGDAPGAVGEKGVDGEDTVADLPSDPPARPAGGEKAALAVRLAAMQGMAYEVKKLLAAFPSSASDTQPGTGMTALHCACLFGNVDVVGHLLGAGADAKMQDSFGRDAAAVCPPGSTILPLVSV